MVIKQQLAGIPGADITNPTFLQLEVEVLQELDIDIADCGVELLAGPLPTQKLDAKLPNEITLLKRLLQKVEDTAMFALLVAERLTSADKGILGLGMMSAPTLGEAIDFSVKAINTGMTPSTLRSQFLRTATHFRIEFLEQCDDAMVDLFLTDRTTIATAIHYQEIASFEPGDIEVFLRHTKPRNSERFYSLLGSSLTFDQPVSAVRFKKAFLKCALPNANWRTFSACENYFDNFPAAVAPNSISQLVKSILIGDCALSLEKIAEEIGVNTRTLHRRLAREETSFQSIVESVKVAKAERLLKSGASVKETAIEMNYADQASFSRAFTRWTGKSPSSIKPTSR